MMKNRTNPKSKVPYANIGQFQEDQGGRSNELFEEEANDESTPD